MLTSGWNKLGLALTIGAALVGGGAHGDDSVKNLLSLSLEELADYVVVAPTRLASRVSDVPGAVSVITFDQIRRSGARTIPELLRLVPGVNVRWNPMVQTIDIRGYGSNPFTSKVLLLIDDIPYNSWNKGGFPQHPGFDFFNVRNVKHIEVIRGAGSALYGENAFNGVINIVTLSGNEFASTQATVFAGDRDTAVVDLAHGQALGTEGALFASARYQRGRLPSEMWDNSDSDGYDLFLKAEYGGATATYYRRDDEFEGFSDPFGGPAFPPGAEFASVSEIKQTVNIASLQYEHEAEDQSWSFKGNLSYANRDGSHCGACHARAESPDFRESADHGDQLIANLQVSLSKFEGHDILLGAEFRRLDSGDHDEELLGGNPDEHADHGADTVLDYNKAALFLQDQITLFNENLKVIAGVRYDSATNPSLFGEEFSPRVALVATPTARMTLRTGWNEAVRYPSFGELYQDSWFLAVEAPGFVLPLASFTPNPDLQPERIKSFEFGLDYFISDKYQLKLDTYLNYTDDSIIINYPLFRFENHGGDVKTHGFELELRAHPRRNLTGFINWAYQETDRDDDGRDLSGNRIELTYAPRHKVNMALTFNPNERLRGTLEANWVGKYTAPAFWAGIVNPGDANGHVLDDYLYLNARLDYSINLDRSAQRNPLVFSLYARNLLDEHVVETLTGVGGPVPGRQIFASIQYDWSL